MKINKLGNKVDITFQRGKYYKTLNFSLEEFNRLSTFIYELQ